MNKSASILSPKNLVAYPVVEIIRSQVNDIHFHLALEEFIYDHKPLEHPILLTWRNDKTIVIGRHQNPWKECFVQEMEKDGVALARRKSGGGAVYQDKGNSVFSFLTPVTAKEANPFDYRQINNQILLESFANVGVEAELSGRNDIILGKGDGRKFSGSAYQVSLGDKEGRGKKSLHHGTVLLNLDMTRLQKYLNPNKKKLESKGISSVVSRVVNLTELQKDLTHEKMTESIEESFKKHYHGLNSACDVLSRSVDLELLNDPKLKEIYENFRSKDWLYQSTPEFTNNIETRFDWGIIDVFVKVEASKITEAKVFSDCLHADYISSLNSLLNKQAYEYSVKSVENLCDDLDGLHPDLMNLTADLRKWLPGAL